MTAKKTKKNTKKITDAFHKMEKSGPLPLFNNDVEVLELNAPLDVDPTDLDIIKTVNVVVAVNNCVNAVKMTRRVISEAYGDNPPGPLAVSIDVAYTELLATQANAMRSVTKQAKKYANKTRNRKITPQRYERAYSKTETVR